MSLRFHALGLSFVAALTFAACGDDDDDDTGGGDAGAANEAGASSSGGSGTAEGGVPGSAGSGTPTAGTSAGGVPGGGGADAGGAPGTSFFVTSDTSATGDIGGLDGADQRCQDLADAAGIDRTFHAYLSVEVDASNDDMPTNARDRIGTGPWYNALGELVAADLDALHELTGAVALFVDENGDQINGQWAGSPIPNQHDIFTGSDADGNLVLNATCADWTSALASDDAQVGHSDGLGPEMDATPPRNSWNAAHTQACDDTSATGGAGKLYCFAID